LLGTLGHGENLGSGHEALFLEAGIVMCALGAVAAVFAATTGLHTQQRAQLDFVLRPEFQKHAAALLNQVKKGTVIDLLEFF
jgi:hypothetical protein